MKNILIIMFMIGSVCVYSQYSISGTVVDENNLPLAAIQVTLRKGAAEAITNSGGIFTILAKDNKLEVTFSGQGYSTREVTIKLPLDSPLRIVMYPKISTIEEVNISTGYQKIPKERSTGAFSFVGKELLNKQITTNIMERLPAIANGVMIDNGTSAEGQLMVRGISTLQGPKNPLIILDDFPYEGNLSNINPEMVASITVLKDAAASSIWGARAANGVIVITTKTGKFNQPLNVELTVNTTLTDKPDLSYLRQMASSDFIDVEQELFTRSFYNSEINSPSRPVLSPVVDLLNQEANGIISNQEAERRIGILRQVDVRDQYKKYMYTPAVKQQYGLNLSGGSSQLSWISGFGYDKNSGNLSEDYERTNLRLQNTWKPSDKISFSAGAFYTMTHNRSGRTGYGGVKMNGKWQIPYIQFADESGQPLSVFSTYNQRYKESLNGIGLLDWNYYPLTDWQNSTTQSNNAELILNASVQYKVAKGLLAELRYQYQKSNLESNTLFDKESYYARNYLNSFAYYDASNILKWRIPKGGILDKSTTVNQVNNLRAQINYTYSSTKHEISAIAGAETRDTQNSSDQNRLYGYDPVRQSALSVDYLNKYPNYVTGGMEFISNRQSMQEINTKFVSLYSNAAYTFDKKYTVSGSLRRDASNLFGLKTNDQWNPFWSAGVSWKLSDENFYSLSWLPNLRLRASYGFSGNIDPAMVAVTTILYDPSPSTYTGSGMARIDQYYNPNLRWETSRMINLALDFSTNNNRISGSLDFFTKKGSNLFGSAPLDYTTGITTMLWNVAGMKGKGFDFELKTRNMILKSFRWDTILNLSTYRDEITDYYLPNTFVSNFINASGAMVPISGTQGLPVYSIFAYQWAGLDPATGSPRGYINGEVSNDYAAITGSEKGIEDLQYFGSALPTTYGSIINTLTFERFSLDFAINYKLGYWFRRNSINYTDLLSSRLGHSDFTDRWQKPGDEVFTNVPSLIYTTNSSRDAFYNGSSVLVQKGDHVRLQYLNMGYELAKNQWMNLPFRSMRIYGAISNLGILWSANKQNLDPDYSWGANSLKPVTTYSLGFHLKF